MTRRAKGEGSIDQLRNGRWRVRVTIDGRTKAWILPTKPAAAARLRQVAKERDAGVAVSRLLGRSSNMRLKEYVAIWLDDFAIRCPRTVFQRRQILRGVVRELGDIRLRDLTAERWRRYVADRLAAGSSPTTVRCLHVWMRRLLKDAVAAGLLQGNPLDGMTTPAGSGFRGRPLTTEESRRLLAECMRDPLIGTLVALDMTTGMRRGEICALTWRDVDWDRSTISVNKSVAFQGGRPVVREPKTRSSVRTVPVGAAVMEMLREHRIRVEARKLSTRSWSDLDLVFPALRGGFWYPFRLRTSFRALLSRARDPQIRFHDLRHTAGTLITRNYNLVVASRILGHASPVITAAMYAHAQSEDFARAVAKVEEVLTGDQNHVQSHYSGSSQGDSLAR